MFVPMYSNVHTENTKIKPYVITDFSPKRKEEFFKTHSPT